MWGLMCAVSHGVVREGGTVVPLLLGLMIVLSYEDVYV